jgi:hypothetical protein
VLLILSTEFSAEFDSPGIFSSLPLNPPAKFSIILYTTCEFYLRKAFGDGDSGGTAGSGIQRRRVPTEPEEELC